MKKTYQTPELEHIVLELDEPITAKLGTGSNIFTSSDETELPEIKEL